MNKGGIALATHLVPGMYKPIPVPAGLIKGNFCDNRKWGAPWGAPALAALAPWGPAWGGVDRAHRVFPDRAAGGVRRIFINIRFNIQLIPTSVITYLYIS